MSVLQSNTWNVRSALTAFVLASVALLTSWTAGYTQQDVAGATQRLRDLYLLRDYERGVVEGKEWSERAPEALKLRAWYVLNLARDDRVDEAVEEADAMVGADSTSPWSWFALAGALNRHEERGEEALTASARALAMAPDDIDFIWLRADVLRRQESNEAAITFADGLPPEVRGHPLVLVRKAVALHFLSDETDDQAKAEEAFAVFERARQADSLNLEAQFLAGSYLLNKRRIGDAYPLLRRAATLSPATDVHQEYWRAVQRRQDLSPEEKRAEIETDVASLLAQRGDSPGALWAVASVYRDLKLEEKQEEFEQRVLELYPDSEHAEWVLVYRYRALARELDEQKRETGAEDPEKRERYRQMLVDFIERAQHTRERLLGDAYRELFTLIKDDTDVDHDYLHEVVEGMVKYEGINPHIVYAGGAIALAEHKTHFEEAERLAREGILEAKKKIDSQKEWGAYETEGDYEKALNWYTGIMYDALGWVYFNQGRLDEAESELLHAYDLNHQNLTNLYHLGRLYETRYDRAASGEEEPPGEDPTTYLEKAEEFYIKGVMVQGPGENPNDEALRALYEKRHGTLEGYEEYLANAEEIDRQRRHEKILAERLEQPEPIEPFGLSALDGSVVSSAELEGKIIAINFWGTWCGACVVEMPEFQKFHEKYRDDADVVVLTINNDYDTDALREWMEKYEYDFVVLLDAGYAQTADVHAFPTTWFLDRQGRIAFSKRGWSEKLAEEFSWRVEALRAPQEP